MYDPYVSHEITIRDLLTHRSGLGQGEGDLLDWPPSTYTRQDIVYKVRFMKPATTFRSQFAYSNIMYVVACEVLGAVTGKSWEDNIRERILGPLGMKTTTLTNLSWKPGDNYAWPHSKLNDKLQVINFGADAKCCRCRRHQFLCRGDVEMGIAATQPWQISRGPSF